MELAKTENRIEIADRSMDLTLAQKACYDFIVDKINSKEIITRKSIVEIYKNKILRNKTYWTNDWVGDEYKLVQKLKKDRNETYYIRPAAMQWFKSSIGALVVRGKFLVLPVIDIE
jgi:hypothetical protein